MSPLIGIRSGRIRTAVLIGALLIAIAGQTPAHAMSPGDTTVASMTASPSLPNIVVRSDGKTVAWNEEDQIVTPDGPNLYAPAIAIARLPDKRRIEIKRGPASDPWSPGRVVYSSPDVSGNLIAWVETTWEVGYVSWQIHAWDTVTKTDSIVASETKRGTISDLRIAGSWVVWTIYGKLMARDIRSAEAPMSVTSDVVDNIDVDQGKLYWSVDNVSDADVTHAALYAQRLGVDPDPALLADRTGINLSRFDVAGDMAVFVEPTQTNPDGTIQLVSGVLNTRTGATRAIKLPGRVSPSFREGNVLATDGRYVLRDWVIDIGGSTCCGHVVEAYDLATDGAFDVMTVNDPVLSLADGQLVWSERYPINPVYVSIHVAPFTAGVPTASLSPPDMGSPDRTYFAETGHYLAYGFKAFWEHNGGLPVFGYPLTEEFTEQNHTVQFTERQRFEYHPEFAGTPYVVELGLLGDSAAERANLLDTAPFQPLPGTTSSDANCTFFEPTGHRLCLGFRSYWQSHGLDMGDPGTAYRESLALFGYPISEEFVDPQTGYVTQYFERAVFEYHPEHAGTPYSVLLRRLGAEELQARGWMP